MGNLKNFIHRIRHTFLHCSIQATVCNAINALPRGRMFAHGIIIGLYNSAGDELTHNSRRNFHCSIPRALDGGDMREA